MDRSRQYDFIADLYDGYPGNYLEDIVFFVEEAKRIGGPVLEVGVGTGRLAFCLASVGLDVVGIDSSAEMLRVMKRKEKAVGSTQGRVQVLAADMRQFSLWRRFRMAIVAFRTFLYLLTRADQLRMLRTLRPHLEPDGLLAMSFFVPPKALLERKRTEPCEMTRFSAPDGDGEIVAIDWTEFVPESSRLISHIAYEWRDESARTVRRLERTLEARYVFPKEMPSLLQEAGYEVVHAYGGFDRSPLGEHAREQIWFAKPMKEIANSKRRESR